MSRVRRDVSTESATVALTAVLATTAEIQFQDFAAGAIHIPNASTITGLTFWSCATKGGVYGALYRAFPNEATAVVMVVAADKAYPIPVECAGCEWIKIVADNAGNVTISKKS